MNKPVIAHVMWSYLAQSETFIWQYLHSFKKIFPIVISNSIENLDQFPLPNGEVYHISLSRWTWSWIKDNFYRRMMRLEFGYKQSLAKNKNVQLIHAHFGDVGYNYLGLSQSLGIPLITTFYGYDLSRNDMIDNYKQAYKNLFSDGSLFLVEGPNMKEKLLSLGCPEEKIEIQRIAIDLEKYELKNITYNNNRPIRILFVGRFVEKKGLEYALKSLSKLIGKFKFQFRIIGSGPLEANLHKLAIKLGFEKEIAWLGVQPHERVIEELQKCDILIQPSITAKNSETEGGAPTIVIEAQACGIPVVSTTHADIPYVTKQNDSALLSPEADVKSLTKSILYLFKNPKIWPNMGKIGREYVEEFHDIKKEVEKLESIYEKLIG